MFADLIVVEYSSMAQLIWSALGSDNLKREKISMSTELTCIFWEDPFFVFAAGCTSWKATWLRRFLERSRSDMAAPTTSRSCRAHYLHISMTKKSWGSCFQTENVTSRYCPQLQSPHITLSLHLFLPPFPVYHSVSCCHHIYLWIFFTASDKMEVVHLLVVL